MRKKMRTVIANLKLRIFGIRSKSNKLTHSSTIKTIVPRSFEKEFKIWDKEKFKNITYID